jgi:U3 small nucleolar RNA-associated protein 3
MPEYRDVLISYEAVHSYDLPQSLDNFSHFFPKFDITSQSIGATRAGLQLLLNKAVVQTTATLNLAVYLMLKREAVAQGQDPAMMQTHPIMSHLQKLNTTLSQIQDVEAKHGIPEQMRNVVKASALLSGDAVSFSSSSASDNDGSSGDASSEDDEDVEETDHAAIEKAVVEGGSDDSSSTGEDDNENSSSHDDDDNDEAERARSVLTEARFGLRANEVVNNESTRKRRRAILLDAGDDDGDDPVAAAAAAKKQKSKKSKSSLAGTLNSIDQRTATKTRKLTKATEDIDDDTKIRRSLAMMEEELGPASDDEGKPTKQHVDDKQEREDQEEADGDDKNEFYDKLSKRSQAHREYKKQLHAVAPKFPRVDGMVAGERAAARHIIKNRGLVAHKKKINRNPRVKKREQFRKALIRRKGAVREVRTDEGHRYGGEETGIKINLSRSRKLA